MLDSNELRMINTFRDAAHTLLEMGVYTDQQMDEFTGFGILPGAQKETLVGVTFLIIQFEFKVGKYETSFVDCHIITTDDRKLILRDSSLGIHEQLKDIYTSRVKSNHPFPSMGVYARKGLKFKDNSYIDSNGKPGVSRTYYLS